MHQHPAFLQTSALALTAMLLSGCALQPKSEDIRFGVLPQQTKEPSLALVTSGGFCVALSEQGTLLTQACDKSPRQQFNWDAGALQLAQRCLIATGADGLTMTDCQDDSHQWQWQADRLFNQRVSLCLDVAGRRHQPDTPLRLAECYGGANQSFEWRRDGSLLNDLILQSLGW